MYEILKVLGEGTFLAMQEGRFFALKEITPAECEVYRRLSSVVSPFAARVWGTVLQDDVFYAVRDFVPGITLAEKVAENGVFGESETRRIGAMVCEGLEAIHACGIVHRDITPNNIILTQTGQAVIIDYGISRLEQQNCRRDTQILGTQGYASPEQYGFSQTSCRSDIYSLGAVMNYMLTGCLPVVQPYRGEMRKILERCLQMDENSRFQSAGELRSALNGENALGASVFRALHLINDETVKSSVIRKAALIVYYVCAAIPIYLAFKIDYTLYERFITAAFLFFVLDVSVFFAADVFRWSRRIPTFAQMTPLGRALMRLVLTVGSFVAAMVVLIVFS